MGEVWVHYTVEMIEPIIPKEVGIPAKRLSLLTTNSNAGVWRTWMGIPFASSGSLTDLTYNALTPSCAMNWSITNNPPLTYDINFGYNSARVYFSPGVWVIEALGYFTTAPTSYPLLTFTAGDNAIVLTGSTEAGTFPNSFQTADYKVFNQLFMVQVSKKGGWVETSSSSTNASSAVLGSATMRFTRLDAGY